jgi:hypothetical protein
MIQLVGAAQRAVLAARSNWLRFSAQFIIEGIGRIVVTVLIVTMTDISLMLLISANVLVQALAVCVPVIRYRWVPAVVPSPIVPSEIFRMFAPLLIAAVAIQSFLTLAPFLMRTLGEATAIQVALLGGAIQFIRIPVTFSSPITLPVLNKIAVALGPKHRVETRKMIRQVIGLLVSIWFVFGVLVFAGGLTLPDEAVVYGPEITPVLLGSVVLACTICPVTVFCHSTALVMNASRTITVGWIIGLIVYAGALFLLGNTASGAVLAIAFGAGTAGIIFMRMLRSDLSL